MTKLLIFLARGARAAIVVAACVAGIALPGCYPVETEPDSECDRDSDCDGSQFCTGDGQCESSCGEYCSTSERCSETNLTPAECRNSCALLVDSNAECSDAFVVLAGCWERGSNCDVLLECASEFDRLVMSCVDQDCDYVRDGACDEGTFCPPGTDTDDCSGRNSCAYRYNGTCESSTYCAAGTDAYDCGG